MAIVVFVVIVVFGVGVGVAQPVPVGRRRHLMLCCVFVERRRRVSTRVNGMFGGWVLLDYIVCTRTRVALADDKSMKMETIKGAESFMVQKVGWD